MVFLKILQNSQESTCARVSFLTNCRSQPATLLKKMLWHRCFSCEFCEMSKNAYFTEKIRWLLLKHLFYKTASLTLRIIGIQNKSQVFIITSKMSSGQLAATTLAMQCVILLYVMFEL